MGRYGVLFFGDEDYEIIKEIARVHKLDVEKVEEAYKEMLNVLKEKADS